ncbi:Heat stress transcription factor A-2b [Sesamum alatum]|uniref:Heat stress transcription factor n=1 Tax=Sesamum alatum TaxID=300844 RepID=A0AAE1XUQ6_9LAMI|nr:Heat stress transcription factor A-2b [Sesamum alatum]
MDPLMFPVKEEYQSGSCPWQQPSEVAVAVAGQARPRPMEGLHDIGPPPFLTKTYEMVDDYSTDRIVSWSRGGHSFVVWDPHAFSTTVLSRYFKHNNFSSFVRQLNTYGFRKIDPDKWEFANESFLRGQKHLLRNIKRRKATTQPPPPPPPQAVGPCVELGRFGLDAEIDSLRRDKRVLTMELIKLRQQQQNTRAYLQQMELRLQGTERKQQQMMSFLARAMQNPEFIHQLVQHKEKKKELEEAMSKKRRRPIEAGESSRMNEVKAEPLEFGDHRYGFQVSELEALALEMQGFGRARREETETEEEEEEVVGLGSYDKELDQGFWEELLNEGLDEVGMGRTEEEGEEEEDVSVLADRLGFLSSSIK